MFLASCGYWGGNPQAILEAPANLVLSALDFAFRKEKEKAEMITSIWNAVNSFLSGVAGRLMV